MEANVKAISEMKALASKGDMQGLADHQGTPSPKVQAYKQTLLGHVAAAKANQPTAPLVTKVAKPVETSPSTPFDKSIPTAEFALPSYKDLTFVKTLPGSTSPKLMVDKQGKEWVVKDGVGKTAGGSDKLDHIKNEEEANKVYRALGVPVPKSGLIEGEHGQVKVAEYLHGKTYAEWEKTATLSEKKAMKAEVSKHFAADALLGNWDVVGQNKDNILIRTSDSKPYRIDNGGALKYRAQGAEKGAAFGHEVKELEDMRDPGKNPQTAKMFSGLTDLHIHDQIKGVLSKKASVLDAITDPISKGTIQGRFWDLETKLASYNKLGGPLKKSASSSTESHVPMKLGVHDVHTANGLIDYISSKTGGGQPKFTPGQLEKIKHLNPDGVKSNLLLLPFHPKQLKDGYEKIEHLKSILPAGTDIKSLVVNTKHLTGELGQKIAEKVKKLKKLQTGTMWTEAAPEATPGTAKQAITVGETLTLKSGKAISEAHVAWAKSITSSEQSAISSWKGSSQGIRKEVSETKNNPVAGSKAYHFMSAVNKQQNYEGVTYRGIHDKGGDEKYATDLMAHFEANGVGSAWWDDAPMNTSRDPKKAFNSFAKGDLALRIKMKTGRPTEPSDGYGYEKEVIGMPGVKYRVVGIYKNPVVATSKGVSLSKVKMMVDLEEI